jgi:hypothetical protein
MKLIWSKRAIEAHERGGYDPRHTISNVTPSSVDSFTRQFRAGCPWIVTDDEGNVLQDSRTDKPEPSPELKLYDLPIFAWAWREDGRDLRA